MMENGERYRRLVALVLQWGGWLYAIFILVWATTQYDPAEGRFAPQWVGLSFILSIGIAIAGTTARSRMRLSDTIVDAFRTGMEAQKLDAHQKFKEAQEHISQREGDE